MKDEVIAQVQQKIELANWSETVIAALQALVQAGGGDPLGISGALAEDGLHLELQGLWPAGVDSALPLVHEALLTRVPREGQPADKVLRPLLNTYTLVLRDPTQLPAQLAPAWAQVRQVYNQLAALQALLHQWRLEPEAPAVAVTLYGPVAPATTASLAHWGVTCTQQPMAKPWARGFQGPAEMPVLVVGQRTRDGRAGVGQQQEVLARAQALAPRRFARTKQPAWTRTPQPTIYHSGAVSDYTVFDLEFSSGSAAEGMFVTEIGAVKIRGGKLVDAFNVFVKVPARRRLNQYSQRVTGIHATTLKRYGLPADQAVRQFLDFIGGDVVLGFSMHGGDLPVLQRQFGLYPAAERLIDVAQLAKAAGPMPGDPEVSLSRYRHYLGLSLLAHGALYDAVTTYALYAYLQGQPLAPEAVASQFQSVFAQTSLKGAVADAKN